MTTETETRRVVTYRGTSYSSANFLRLLRQAMERRTLYCSTGLGSPQRIYNTRIDQDGGVILGLQHSEVPYSGQFLDDGRDQVAF